ncbi:MAG: rhodanese-like domain-containing protein [Sphaerochaeta sp.]|uniref:rhodanese-like domain-containing protein n=1 Tax=Sphaerochaeta sp. TaxID=1972642 RepID=UPI002FC603E1
MNTNLIKWIILGVAAVVVVLVAMNLVPSKQATASSESQAVYRKITADEAKAMMDGSKSVTILDVRTPAEFASGHIEKAINIANETIGGQRPAGLPDLDATILVYCRSGNRSAQAANKLVAMGYTNIYDFGGLNTWKYGTVQ